MKTRQQKIRGFFVDVIPVVPNSFVSTLTLPEKIRDAGGEMYEM